MSIQLTGSLPCLPSSRRRLIDRLTWHLLIGHRGVIRKRRQNDSRLLQIFSLNPVIHILVGMMCATAVFQRVLNKLESRQADRIERLVVGPTCARQRQRRGVEITERFQPLAE